MTQRDIYQLPAGPKAQTPPWVRTGISLGVGLILLGVVVLGIAGGSILSALTGGSHQISFPGSANLKLKPGIYVGIPAPHSPPSPSGLFVAVTNPSTGESIPVQTGPEMTVALAGSQIGQPLFQFETFDAGTYLVSGTASDPTAAMQVLILHESLGRTRSDLVVGLLSAALLIAGGIVLLWQVRKKKRELI